MLIPSLPSLPASARLFVAGLLCLAGFGVGRLSSTPTVPVARAPVAACEPSPVLEAAHARHAEVLRVNTQLEKLSCLVQLSQQQRACKAAIDAAVQQVTGARRLGGL